MGEISYKVYGLDCAEECAILKKVVGSHSAIYDLRFDVISAKMTVTYNPEKIHASEIIDLIGTTGMRAILWEERGKEKIPFWQRSGRSIMALLCFLFLLAGFISHAIYHPDLIDILGGYRDEHLPHVSKVLYLFAAVCGMVFVIPKAYRAVVHFSPDMNVLMVIAVIGAIAIDQWFEAAMVVFLFSLANWLEFWSVGRARRAISSLLDLSPMFAIEIDPKTGALTERSVEDVRIGVHILIRPGEKIPLDGIVMKGFSSVNQAPITGESIPVAKHEGDEVFAGTLNEEGALEVKVVKKAQDTTLARIIRLAEASQAKRAASQQWVDGFAKFYTPIMFLFALLLAFLPPLFFGQNLSEWIYKGLVILVIACPCALVISTPVSIVSGLTAAARNGILIKGGMYLELAGKLRALAMDKTGTLTQGKPSVQRIVSISSLSEEEILSIAISLEHLSEHPLARAILKKGDEKGISLTKAEKFISIKGKGVEGKVHGKRYWMGSHRFLHEKGNLETPQIHKMAESLEDAGHSVVALGDEREVCGFICIADEPRPWMKETILAIKAEGVKKVVMLTGDNLPAARALAQNIGVDAFHAELLPEDKAAILERLVKKWNIVGMVGDGINDAPALAASRLGIAMGAMGSDVAIETADIALMTDDLSKIPWLIRHSQRVLRLIKQNIIFSLSIKFAFIILALLGLASLWMAIAADTGAAILVIFNGLRSLQTRTAGILMN